MLSPAACRSTAVPRRPAREPPRPSRTCPSAPRSPLDLVARLPGTTPAGSPRAVAHRRRRRRLEASAGGGPRSNGSLIRIALLLSLGGRGAGARPHVPIRYRLLESGPGRERQSGASAPQTRVGSGLASPPPRKGCMLRRGGATGRDPAFAAGIAVMRAFPTNRRSPDAFSPGGQDASRTLGADCGSSVPQDGIRGHAAG